ncbi:uncharacterized, partial [Tachysurus ichikawai]
MYEFAICPRSGDAPAELGTIWLVRDFLPLFLLSEPDSWMPANRGRGAWQLRAESIALMQRKLSTAYQPSPVREEEEKPRDTAVSYTPDQIIHLLLIKNQPLKSTG